LRGDRLRHDSIVAESAFRGISAGHTLSGKEISSD